MNGINESTAGSGPFEPRYLAILDTIGALRPSLHRSRARMTGSVVDGDDVLEKAEIGSRWFLMPRDRGWLVPTVHDNTVA